MNKEARRRENESELEYGVRLYSNQAVFGMKNNEIYELYKSETGDTRGESTIRCYFKAVIDGMNLRLETQGSEEDKKIKTELEEIKKEKVKIEKEISKLEAKEERRLKVVEFDGFYTIFSKTRELQVLKETVAEIKRLYCDKTYGIGVAQLCRQLGIARRDFMLIKHAFNIVHDDVPLLDEDLMEGDIDSLVNDALEKQKEQYFIKFQEKEISEMKKELKNYREKDYLYNKIIDNISEIVIEPRQCNITIPTYKSFRAGLLDLADTHFGFKYSNYFGSYSVDIARQRMEDLTDEVIETCYELGVTELHVSSLGDLLAGIIHDSIAKQCELTIEKQVALAVELITKMLVEFGEAFDKVVYSDVFGNHGRIFASKDKCTESENFEYFIGMGIRIALRSGNYDNIFVEDNVIDDTIVVKEIAGVKIYEVHGHLDKFTRMATDLGMMFGKSDEVHCGHYHHNKSEEFHQCEVFMSRSFAGIDDYAKNNRLTSKAGQRLYVYSNGKREFLKDIIFDK